MAFVVLNSLILDVDYIDTVDEGSGGFSDPSSRGLKEPSYFEMFLSGGRNTQTTFLVFLVSFGIFLCITKYTRLNEPAYQTKIQKELTEDLQALGPFKLSAKGKDNAEVLTKEKTLIFAKVLLRHELKLRAEVKQEGFKERRALYDNQSWPYYEQSHDRLLESLIKCSKELEMAAATSVGLSRRNWQDSLDVHFAYPNKDQALVKLYKEVVEEFRKPISQEHTKSICSETIGPAWRWLVLREADTEDKMVQIIQKNDRSTYHKVKAYEQAKTEDQLLSEFSVDQALFLDFEKHYKLKDEDHTINFVRDLDQMLEAKDQSWLGTEARQNLWHKLDVDCSSGPITFEQMDESASSVSFDECDFRLAIGPFCRILEIVDSVCTPRIRHLRNKITEARRDAYAESNWDKHAFLMQVLGFQDVQIREEALSFALFKLDLPFELFQKSFEFFIANKATKTQHEFSLIQKMQTKCAEREDLQIKAEMSDKLLTRD